MRKVWRTVILLSSGAAVLACAGLLLAYRSAQEVPPFYEKALKVDRARQAESSRELLQQASTLVNEARREGRWEAVFTADQINGWLAVDLEFNHPGLLPPEVSDPRISIREDGASLGCRWEKDSLGTVFSLDVDLYLAEPNVIALQVHGARAGRLPLPLNNILDGIAEATRRLNLGLSWLQTGGEPVAMITIPPPESENDSLIIVEALELRDGEVYLSGKTVPREHYRETQPAVVSSAAATRHAVTKVKRQL